MSYQVPTWAVPAIYTDEAKKLYEYLSESVQATVNGTRHESGRREVQEPSSGSTWNAVSALFSKGIFIDASTKNIGIFNNSNNRTVTHINSADSAKAKEEKARKEENNKAALIITGLAFVALGGLYSYFLGKSIAQKGDAETDLIQVEKLRKIAEGSQGCATYLVPSDAHSFTTQMCHVNDVVDASKNVFVFKRSEAMTDIVLNTSLIGAAIIGAIGSVMASSILLGAGITGGLGVAVVKLIKLGINATNSKRMQLYAETVQSKTKTLLGVVSNVHNPKGDNPVVMGVAYVPPTASAPREGE